MAIQKIADMKELNSELTYFLFHPEKLPMNNPEAVPFLEKTYQKDANGNLIRYNDNQVKAIFNALERTPLSIDVAIWWYFPPTQKNGPDLSEPMLMLVY